MYINEQEILEYYNQYISNLSNGVKQVAEYFRTDQLEKGLKGVIDFSEGLTWLTLSNKFLASKNKIMENDFSEIKSYLREINEGLEFGDYILVADILEYEIATYFEGI